ncbi:MAG: TRAP transporter small permease [Pyramidobacter sp.]|nr:TRAP transporter small permease [Pyramidobacter sp.]
MYNNALKKVIWFIERILIIMLAITVCIILMQIVARYVLGTPLKWSEQMARMLFIWMIMLGVPVCFYRKSTVAFDLILDLIKGNARKGVDILIDLIIFGFAAFFFIYSFQLCIETGGRMTAGVVLPQNLLYVSMPISMGLLCLVMIGRIIDSVKDLVHNKADKEA